MSKGTVRFPPSAIVDGRIGTSRIAATVAGAAARLALADHVPLDAATSRMVAMPRGVKTDISNTSGVQLVAPHVAACAKHRANAALGEKPAPGKRETPQGELTPVQRMQQLGRLGTGRMNKTEAAYEQVLAARLHIGEILFYRFEAHKLRLADNTFYTPDFTVIVANGSTEYHEVKGRWTDKARTKIKVAATQHPYRFIAIKRAGRHGWSFEDLTSRSW
ncbi:hypothetical protein [Paraburkholderia xenovorans]|jgi:hypothetical protein